MFVNVARYMPKRKCKSQQNFSKLHEKKTKTTKTQQLAVLYRLVIMFHHQAFYVQMTGAWLFLVSK
jgi:hypothetical protein